MIKIFLYKLLLILEVCLDTTYQLAIRNATEFLTERMHEKLDTNLYFMTMYKT